jgi:hypothetical protein
MKTPKEDIKRRIKEAFAEYRSTISLGVKGSPIKRPLSRGKTYPAQEN